MTGRQLTLSSKADGFLGTYYYPKGPGLVELNDEKIVEGFYTDRTACSHRNHRDTGRDTLSGVYGGQGHRAEVRMYQQHAPDRFRVDYVTDDNSGLCPSLWNDIACLSWPEELMPYVNNCAVFGCPSSGIVPASSVQFLCTAQVDYDGYLSYGWNATLFNYTSLFPVKQSDIYKLTGTVFLADVVEVNWLSLAERTGTASNGSGTYVYTGISWNEPPYPFPSGTNAVPSKTLTPDACHIAYRHNGFANVCFCDGHVVAGGNGTTKVQSAENARWRG